MLADKHTAISLPLTAGCTCAIANGRSLFPFPDHMLLGQGGVGGHVCLICPYLSPYLFYPVSWVEEGLASTKWVRLVAPVVIAISEWR